MFGLKKAEPGPAPRWRKYAFEPQRDITAYELAVIVASASSSGGGTLDEGVYLPADRTIEAWLAEAGIPEAARHFRAEYLIGGE